jgi:micrococcal nuclease
MEKYSVDIEKIVDGDTFDVIIHLGFNVLTKIRIRLYGVDTHEIFGVEKYSEQYNKGMKEKAFVEQWIRDSDFLEFQTQCEKGKYGRWLGYIIGDGENLSDRLRREFTNVS